MLNCHDATRLMSERYERKLGTIERLTLRLHLVACRSCSRFEQHMGALRMFTRSYGKGEVDPAATPPKDPPAE